MANSLLPTLLACALFFSLLSLGAAQGNWSFRIGNASSVSTWQSAPSDCGFQGDPSSGFYAAISSSLFQAGEACNRKYMMSCMGMVPEEGCKDQAVMVEVIQECQDPCPVDFVLTSAAFDQIASVPVGEIINIGYRQQVKSGH